MGKCPRCGTYVAQYTKEWDYRHRYYHVKKYYCPKCEQIFMEYFHNNKLSHTIPKAKSSH